MKLITILGPTASGKTKFAIKLARIFNGEIINADSRAIYKELEIGTAKPIKQERNSIKHHLIDFLKPNEKFSVAEYQKLVFQEIKEITKKGKIPFLVGGSMLYIDSVVYNYKFSKVVPDFNLRRKLEKESLDKLISRLRKINPQILDEIDAKNKRRVIRVLELSLCINGQFRKSTSRKMSKDVLILGIKTNKEELYKKINKRVDLMFKRGLVAEVYKLVNKYGWDASAFTGIGYHEIIKYLKKEIDLGCAVELIKKDTRRLAKRQLTWFRRDKNIKWVSTQEESERLIKNFL